MRAEAAAQLGHGERREPVEGVPRPQRLRPHRPLVPRTGRAAELGRAAPSDVAVAVGGGRHGGEPEGAGPLALGPPQHVEASAGGEGEVDTELGQLAGEAGAGGADLDGAGGDVAEALQLGDALAQQPPGPGHVALGHTRPGTGHPVVGPVGGGAAGADGLGVAELVAGPRQVPLHRRQPGRPRPQVAGLDRPPAAGQQPADAPAAVEESLRRPPGVGHRLQVGLEADVEREPGPLRPLGGPQPAGGGGGVTFGLSGVTGGEAGPGQQQAGFVEIGHVVRHPQTVDRRLGLGPGVLAEPGQQHDLGPVGVENRELARRRRQAAVALLGSVEGEEGVGQVPLAAFGEAEVVGRHRPQHQQVLVVGDLLGPGQVASSGGGVAAVAVEDAPVQMDDGHAGPVAGGDEERQRLVVALQ